MTIKNYWNGRFKFGGICDVEENFNFYFSWLLSKLHQLFIWENLPDTIDEQVLNDLLFLDGQVIWFKQNNNLYAVNGSYGGKINEYYLPTEAIVANPVLGSHQLQIGKDCVVMTNSSTDRTYCSMGLAPLINQTATLLADNIVSINCAQINTRIQALVVADSTQQKNSAELIMKELYSGKPFKVLEDSMIDKIKVNPITANPAANISELVELHQYIIAQFYQNVGIKMNAVMKKERLITEEINSQENFLAVSLETMEKARKTAVEKINELFGTEISVKINPIFTCGANDVEEEENSSSDIGEINEKRVAAAHTESNEPFKNEEDEVANDDSNDNLKEKEEDSNEEV